MPDLNLESFGAAAMTIAILLYGLKLAMAKIAKLEEDKDVLHDRNAGTLVDTLKSQNKSISTLDRALEFISSGGRND